jgi:predicted phosphoribosyltransferase
MGFRNRAEAAEVLAWRLRRFAGDRPLVLGIARGGVPMARVVADRLAADLDILLVGQLHPPMQPDVLLGFVDEFGHVCLADFVSEEGVSREYLQAETRAQRDALRARRQRYTAMDVPANPTGRTVILVDDGFATSTTMVAAVRSVRLHKPARVIVATAVASAETIDRLENEAEQVVCLAAPATCGGVIGQFEAFAQVTDEEIAEALGRLTPAHV